MAASGPYRRGPRTRSRPGTRRTGAVPSGLVSRCVGRGVAVRWSGSLAPTAGGITGAVAGGVVGQHLGTEAGFLLLGVGHAAMCVRQVVQWRTRSNRGGDCR